jgi:glutamine amidotransferase PdxT
MAESSSPLVGVLALQGAFEEHQACLEAAGCRTKQVSQHSFVVEPHFSDLSIFS